MASNSQVDPDLLIIGNKADKISKEELETLKKACPRHIFTVSNSKLSATELFLLIFFSVYLIELTFHVV